MLAAIPLHLSEEFKTFEFYNNQRIAQHGYAHINHEDDLSKKSEFGFTRTTRSAAYDIINGFQTIMKLKNSIAAFVPPWNRMNINYLSILSHVGVHTLSTYTPRTNAEPINGLRQVNTHVDVIDWHGKRDFIGTSVVINQIVNHLIARRSGYVDPNEPTGLLTHHLVHDKPCWNFLERLFNQTMCHSAAKWLEIEEAMGA